MSITVICDGCGKAYKVDETAQGKRLRCKACGHTFTVVAAKEAASSVKPATSPAVQSKSARKQAETFETDIDLSSLAALETTGMVDQSAFEPISTTDLKRRNAELGIKPIDDGPKKRGNTFADDLANRGGKNKRQAAAALAAATGSTEDEPWSFHSLLPKGVMGYVWAVAIVACLVALVMHSVAVHIAFYVLLIGLFIMFYGLAAPRSVARNEAVLCYLLYRFVPGYQLYYIVTRWADTSRHIRLAVQGILLVLLGLCVLARAGGIDPVFHAIIPRSASTEGDQISTDDNPDAALAAKRAARRTNTTGSQMAETPQASAGPAAPDLTGVPKDNIAPGVDRRMISVPGNSAQRQLWLYTPVGPHPAKSLPCVLIAAGGSRLYHGMNLVNDDVKEHTPYVQAGFAVMAYSLDGAITGKTSQDFKDAQDTFRDAECGLVNARAAIDYLKEKVPEVDVDRLYAAGHDSAATVALDLAANDPQIKGIAAYAPATDFVNRLAKFIDFIEKRTPGMRDFLMAHAPMNSADRIHCPVLLFHADDDDKIPKEDNDQFAEKLKATNSTVTYKTVPTGGHLDSMFKEGIPAGIQFFQSHGANATPSK